MKKFMLGRRFSFEAREKREKTTKCSLKTTDFLLDAYEHVLTEIWYLSQTQTNTQTLDDLIVFKKQFCLMSDLKFTLFDVTSFLPDNLSGLKKNVFRVD